MLIVVRGPFFVIGLERKLTCRQILIKLTNISYKFDCLFSGCYLQADVHGETTNALWDLVGKHHKWKNIYIYKVVQI
jgi:hypothetical protein